MTPKPSKKLRLVKSSVRRLDAHLLTLVRGGGGQNVDQPFIRREN